MLHELDSPIWNALNVRQKEFSLGDELARRYMGSVGPFAGLAEQTRESYETLSELYEPDEIAILFLNEPCSSWGHWAVKKTFLLPQLVCEDLKRVEPPRPIEMLGEKDIPAMLALTKLTEPGPFHHRTHELGSYFGIFEEGQLVAMAGERFKPQGYTEVSAVCTHPSAQGKGYAKALVSSVSERITERGETPFLHVMESNVRARSVYEQLGFRLRRNIHLAVLERVEKN